jgi:predicted PurR-regulated permease PerM
MAEINATLGAYIRGQLLDAMCVGLMTMGGLWILGFNQAVLLGVLCGFLNPIPFLAPIVGGSLALLIAYFQGMSFAALFGIFWLFVLIRLCDDFFFTPFVVGQSVKLHPVVMLFAILAGVEVGGFMGLVFAVPLAAILKVVLAVAFHNRQQNLILQQNHIVS